MRARLLAGLVLALGGCSLLVDPESVPRPPGCVSTGCTGVTCGGNDNCGNACAPGSGCTPADGAPHQVEGGITGGAAAASPAGAHRVRGELGRGSQHAAGSSNHRIEQGSLR